MGFELWAMGYVPWAMGCELWAEPLAKIRSRAGTWAVANGREGINPSPTEISVGAGFIPARVIANFASGSAVSYEPWAVVVAEKNIKMVSRFLEFE